MASVRRTIYVGITSNLERRVYEHKHKLKPGFTKRYKCKSLVYFENTNDVNIAIEREKQLKGWKRDKKIALIESMNPDWRDLSEKWNE